jgi:acid stress chaperone HdeB
VLISAAKPAFQESTRIGVRFYTGAALAQIVRSAQSQGRLFVARRCMVNRKLHMRSFAALFVGCCLLGGGPAGAEMIDFSKTTCKQFFDTHKGDVSVFIAWLDGYSREENAPPIFDTNEFAAGAKKFSAYCAAHPAVSLTMAADEVFGE